MSALCGSDSDLDRIKAQVEELTKAKNGEKGVPLAAPAWAWGTKGIEAEDRIKA